MSKNCDYDSIAQIVQDCLTCFLKDIITLFISHYVGNLFMYFINFIELIKTAQNSCKTHINHCCYHYHTVHQSSLYTPKELS